MTRRDPWFQEKEKDEKRLSEYMENMEGTRKLESTGRMHRIGRKREGGRDYPNIS